MRVKTNNTLKAISKELNTRSVNLIVPSNQWERVTKSSLAQQLIVRHARILSLLIERDVLLLTSKISFQAFNLH